MIKSYLKHVAEMFENPKDNIAELGIVVAVLLLWMLIVAGIIRGIIDTIFPGLLPFS